MGTWFILKRDLISRAMSPLIRVISIVTLLVAPLRTTHEPPSRTKLTIQGAIWKSSLPR